ncbi:MAG: hypothetical protein ACOYUB_00455 [Patescibacteria group bacterium]
MANKYEAGKRFLRVMLPALGLMVIASCSSAPEPTVSQIRDSLPAPGISPASSQIYTNVPNAEVNVDTQNLYKDHPDAFMDGPGNLEWKRAQWYNPFSPENRLVVSNLQAPNMVYTITLSGENCTPYKGELVCTAPIRQTVNVVYDTIPPEARVTGFEARGGELTIHAQVSDNLAGPAQESVDVTVKNPKLGKNRTKVNLCDNAGNCQDATVEGNYDPFTNVISMQRPRLDPQTGLITVSGTINNANENIDIAKTEVGAKQSILPQMAFGLDQVGLECGVPQFEGFSFNLTCKPRAVDGRSVVKVTIKDKLGNEYEQTYEVEIPPLSTEKAMLFHSLLALALVTDAGLYKKVKGDRVRRERRAKLASAVVNGNRAEMLAAKANLVKKDRKRFDHVVQDFNAFEKIEEEIIKGNPSGAILTLKGLYKRPPHFLHEKREELLMRSIGLIGRFLSEKDWRKLEEHGLKDTLNFLWSTLDKPEYNFLWSAIAKEPGLKTVVLSALILYRGSSRKTREDLKETRIFYGFGLNDPSNFFEYFGEMTQWGDFKSIESILAGLTGRADKRVIELAYKRLDNEEMKILGGFTTSLRRLDELGTYEEKLRQFMALKSRMQEYRFTDAGIINLKSQMDAKEAEFSKMVYISKANEEIRSVFNAVAQSDWTKFASGTDVSGNPQDKHNLLVGSLPTPIKSFLDGKGEWYRYILSNDCPKEKVEPLIKALIVQELIPYALFFGTEKPVDDAMNFQSVMPFNSNDRSFIKLFGPLITNANQDHLTPELFYLRVLWDKMRVYDEAKKTAKAMDLDVQDLLLGFDNSISGKIRTLLFVMMAKGIKYEPNRSGNNVATLIGIMVK